MEPRVPFENYARSRPLRTYSHKTKAASSVVLPLLRSRESPTSLARKHQYRSGARDEDYQVDGVTIEEGDFCQPDDDFENAHELEVEPQYASDTSQNLEDYATEEDTSLEYSTDEDKEERDTPEQIKSTPPSSVKSSSSTKFLSKPVTGQSNRLRRRPFLLFDKLPPRGFKRLKPKAEDSTTSTASDKYKFGDGFSKDEAKPNGLVQLRLRPKSKRKPHVESRIGSLDLTQSSFQSSPNRDQSLKQQTTTKKKKRAYDNSFLPDPKRAERQRKRQKQLKKDDPLKDKELLPPAPVPKPKMVLMSAILGNHSDQANKPQHVPVVLDLGEQREQIQDSGEGVLNEEPGILQKYDKEGNIGAEESTTREESVELGEFPMDNLPRHSAFNHQHEHQQEQNATQEQQEDSAELHSDTIAEKPFPEPSIVVESLRESPKKRLVQPFEKFSEEPSRRTVDKQDEHQQPIHAKESDPKLVTTTVKKSASVEVNSNSNSNLNHPRETETETETSRPVHNPTTERPTRLIPDGNSPRKQAQRRQIEIMASQEKKNHEKGEEAPPTNGNTSPGSGWETYVSETDIHHTPTPPRPPPFPSRAKSAVPSTTSREEESRGLKRSSSAV